MNTQKQIKIFEFFQKEFGILKQKEGAEIAATLILNLIFEFQYQCSYKTRTKRMASCNLNKRKYRKNGN
jgi:hypothetical protein